MYTYYGSANTLIREKVVLVEVLELHDSRATLDMQ